VGQHRDARPAPRFELDEAFVRQRLQGLADRVAAHAELVLELVLEYPLALGHVTGDDAPADGVADGDAQRLVNLPDGRRAPVRVPRRGGVRSSLTSSLTRHVVYCIKYP